MRSAIFGEYNGFNYRFSASGLDAGERRTPNGSISHSEFQNRSFAGRIGYDWGDGEAWLKADAFLGRIHIPSSEPPQGQILYQRTPTAPKTVLNSRSVVTLDLPQWDRWGLAGGFELRNLTPYLTKIKFEAYFQNLKKDFYNTVFVNSWTGPIIIRNTINMHTFNDQDSYGGLLQTDWTFGDHQLIFGADYNRDEITALDERPGNIIFTQMPNTAPPPPFTTTTIRTPYSSFTYRAVQSHLGLFLQDEWKITPDFTATLGIRETWVTSDLQDDGNNPLLRKSKISDSKPVGNIGLVYSGFNDVALRAVWSQGYRFPPLNALYFGTIHGSANATYPNPNLKPETSNNFELGMRFGEGNLNFDIGAFVNMSKNYITVLPEGSINRYTNTDQAQTIGLELALSYNIPETGFTPYTSTTFLRRKFTNTITTQPRYRATERVRYSTYDVGQPNLFGRVGVKFQHEFDNNFLFLSDVYLDWAIKSQQYYYDSDNLHDFAGTGLPADLDYGFVTDESPAWTTFNLALGLEWGTDHRWNATLALKNIFDRDYKIATNVIEEPGFHIVAGVGFEF
ncbi:MAG: TonB-dependent receptor [Deltaproteobacteria bacterium]|nr:TonB-dependent receptor [Deltaproteobacteria bacterium]